VRRCCSEEEFANEKVPSRMLSMGRSTFWNKVRLKQLPQPVKIAGTTRWRVSDLQRFVDLIAA